MSVTDALIIGAGPFGLSISAHLHELGVDHVIVGRTMDTWRSHMPAGMNLKSEPYASVIASPKPGSDIAAYSAAHGLDYVDRVGPLPLKQFLGYADWFAEKFVPDVRDLTVTKVTAHGDGFKVEFAEAEPIVTRQVIVATGVLPHRYVPDELSDLPADLVTHASDHDNLARFQGRQVAVIGAGQSALETAALLNEQGAVVRLIARRPALEFVTANPQHLTTAGRIQRPVTQLCEGWWCVLWSTPALFRLLPEDKRVLHARTVLGPSGSWWLRDRIEGQVDVLTNHRLGEATPRDGGVRLTLDGQGTAARFNGLAGVAVDVKRPRLLVEGDEHVMIELSRIDIVGRPIFVEAPGAFDPPRTRSDKSLARYGRKGGQQSGRAHACGETEFLRIGAPGRLNRLSHDRFSNFGLRRRAGAVQDRFCNALLFASPSWRGSEATKPSRLSRVKIGTDCFASRMP